MRCYLFLLLFLPLAAAAGEHFPWLELEVHADGLGPVKVGMTEEAAGKAFGIPFSEATYGYGDDWCSSYSFGTASESRGWHLRFLVQEGELRRIDIYHPKIRGPHGFGVGTPVLAVMDQYPDRFIVARAYDPSERHVRVPLNNGYSFDFKADIDHERASEAKSPEDVFGPDSRVIRFSIGDAGAGTVEGCL